MTNKQGILVGKPYYSNLPVVVPQQGQVREAAHEKKVRWWSKIRKWMPFGKKSSQPKTTTKQNKEGNAENTKFIAGWILLGFGLAVSVSTYWILPPASVAGLGLCILFISTCMHGIKHPDEAFLFRFGKLRGRLKAGWYLTIPHAYDIKPILKEWVRVPFENEDIYTKNERRFAVSGSVFFRAGDDLDKLILMPSEKMAEKMRDVALAEIRRQVGARTTTGLISELKSIEEGAMKKIHSECEQNGYIAGDFETSGLSSEGLKIEDLGKARGRANKEMAAPFKNNMPGAVAVVGQSFAAPFAKFLADLAKQRAFPKKESSGKTSTGSEPTEPSSGISPDAIQQIAASFLKQDEGKRS